MRAQASADQKGRDEARRPQCATLILASSCLMGTPTPSPAAISIWIVDGIAGGTS